MPVPSSLPPALTGAQKAAIIVRLISAEGGAVPLSSLAPSAQLRLTRQFQNIGKVDRSTVNSVILEFATHLSDPSLRFPDTLNATLQMIEANLSPDVANSLRRSAGLSMQSDPWPEISKLPVPELVATLIQEGPQIGAIVLSKLSPEIASEVMDALPEDVAKTTTYAMEETKDVAPDVVDRIGASLMQLTTAEAPNAFDAPAVNRVADILNAAGSAQRDDMLAALEQIDEKFASDVREAIFTFADIPTRIAPMDVAKFVRIVDGEAMVIALAAAQAELGEAVDYILANMSQRLADQLREDMAEAGSIALKPGEQAMGQVTAAIRKLKEEGEIEFVKPSDDQDADTAA